MEYKNHKFFKQNILFRKFWLTVVEWNASWENISFEKTFASNGLQIEGENPDYNNIEKNLSLKISDGF